MRATKWAFFFVSVFFIQQAWTEVTPMKAAVEVEETVCQTGNPNNGAGAFWCYGAPLIVRIGERVFVSALEVGEGVAPLCNTRPRVMTRGENGWQVVWNPEEFREREPCPLVGFHDGTLALSVNPLINATGARQGACSPLTRLFSAGDLKSPPKEVQPQWGGGNTFTEHSYRGIACDGARGEILLLNIDARTSEQCWGLRDASGAWLRMGKIRFPIRSCYPQVALHNRAAHVLAIGDIVEPIEEWRKYKREKTQREWDYVFRRLFYTYTPDASTTDFATPIEIDTVDATGGHILNLDLWLDATGDAHVLYIKQPIVPLVREKFFPQMRLTKSLEYVVVRKGNVVSRQTLLTSGEGITGDAPNYARFHATPDGRLFVIYASDPSAMKLMPLLPQRAEPVTLPVSDPLRTFFTATERGGSKPSTVIDLFGIGRDSATLRYVRVRLS